MYLSTEIELIDQDEDGGEAAGKETAQEALRSSLVRWWAAHALEPFLKLSADLRLSPMTLKRRFLDGEVAFTVRFDEYLLDDLAEAYSCYGWEAVEQIEAAVARFPRVRRPNLEFLRATRNVLAVMVAQAMTEIETAAAELARERWREARERAEEWLSAFSVLRINSDHPSLADRELAEKLLAACRQYARTKAKVLALQEKINARNRKAPPSRRPAGSGWDLWFEVYAAPQRELLAQLTKELAAVRDLLPCAVLVLDDLPVEVVDDSSRYRILIARRALEAKIYWRVHGLAERATVLEKSLSGPRVTAAFGAVTDPAVARPPAGGYDAEALRIVLGRTGDDDQRVIADLGLMVALSEDPARVPAGTWNQVVLYRYLWSLTEEVDRRRARDKAWATFWEWAARITAALALVGLMLFFPFGGAAVAPGLVTALQLAGLAAAAAGVATLVLHELIGSWQQAGQIDQNVSDQLFRLGQDDPDAIVEIGEALGRSAALRDAVITGALQAVLTMGAAHRVKAFAVALDFQGFVADVETLFGPSDDEGEEGEEQEQEQEPDG